MACLLFSCTGRRFLPGKTDFHLVLYVSSEITLLLFRRESLCRS